LLLITLFSAALRLVAVFGGTFPQRLILPSLAQGAGVGEVTTRFVHAHVVVAMQQTYVTGRMTV